LKLSESQQAEGGEPTQDGSRLSEEIQSVEKKGLVLAWKEMVQEEETWDFGQAVLGAAVSELEQATRRGAFQESECTSSGSKSKPNRRKALACFNCTMQQSAPEEESEAIEGCSQLSHLDQHTTAQAGSQ